MASPDHAIDHVPAAEVGQAWEYKLAFEALKAKRCDDYPCNDYTLTPGPDDWEGTVLEARDYGTPMACFGDTNDKFVLDLSHFDLEFENKWAKGTWYDVEYTTEACIKSMPGKETQYLAWIKKLALIGQLMSQQVPVHFTVMSGSGKGYYGMSIIPLDSNTDMDQLLQTPGIREDICALHVYGDWNVLMDYYSTR